MSSYKTVLDVSTFNTITSWTSISKIVDGVIIRAGYRGYGSTGTIVTDNKFSTYIKAAAAADIPLSVYFFSQAKTSAEAIAEADYTVNLIKDYKISMPIFIDSEYGNANKSGRADSLSKTTRTTVVKAFCSRIETLGYKAGVYASDDWFNENLDASSLTDYSIWVAKYSTTSPKYVSNYIGWQYTSEGSIQGVSGNCDLTKWYGDIGDIENTESVQIEESSSATSTSSSTSNSENYTAGTRIALNNTPIYATAGTSKVSSTKTGTYYIWNDSVNNNRIRITTSKSNVGKTGCVTGWVNETDINIDTTTLAAGDRITASKIPVYNSSTADTPTSTKTGTYYIWSSEVVNDRIRITNTKARVGVTGQTTGWVNIADI